MIHIFYADCPNGHLQKGTRLHSSQQPGTHPILLQEHEFGKIQGTVYLLVDKEPEFLIGSTPLRKGGQGFYFRNSYGDIYLKDIEGNIISTSTEWIKPGIHTNKGRVIDVADNIAIVLTPSGIKKAYRKKELQRPQVISDPEEAQLFYKSLQSASQRSGLRPWQKILKALNLFPTYLTEAREGELRDFSGRGTDIRRLMRTMSGKLRWMDADEERQLMEERARAQAKAIEQPETTQKPEPKPKPKPKQVPTTAAEGKQYRRGQRVVVEATDEKGQSRKDATIHEIGDNVVVVRYDDGSTEAVDMRSTTTRIVRKDVKQEEPKPADSYVEVSKQAKEEQRSRNLEEYKPAVDVPPDQYKQEELESIRKAAQDEAFKKFQERVTAAGYKRTEAFEFKKTIQTPRGLATASKIWDPSLQDHRFKLNNQMVQLMYQGKLYDLYDFHSVKQIEIKDPETGEKKTIGALDLDKYAGQIMMDDQGHAFVVKPGEKPEVLGQFSKAPYITQEDLLKPGTLRIIKDEVWKQIVEGDGASIDYIRLGTIENGVVAYKDGDNVSIIDPYQRLYTVKKPLANSRLSKKRLQEMQAIQKRVQEFQMRINTMHLQDMNLHHVNAATERLIRPATLREIDPAPYKDVLDNFFSITGNSKEAQSEFLDSYGTPAWTDNIKRLADLMYSEDHRRYQLVEETNKQAKSGVLQTLPTIYHPAEYEKAAEELLEGKRRAILYELVREQKKLARSGSRQEKFERHDVSDLPDKAHIPVGKTKIVWDAKNAKYNVQYLLIPKSQLVASHILTEGGLIKNPEYPEELQARLREEPSSQYQIREIAESPDQNLVVEHADATRGAPIVYLKNGKAYVAQGNGRAAGILAMKGEAAQKYHGMVVEAARDEGIRPDQVKEDMVLVRALTPKHTYEDAINIGIYGQDAPTLPMSEVERARQFQIAARTPLEIGNLNFADIGMKPITAENVHHFIRNNPQIYAQMVKRSHYKSYQLASNPEAAASVVNAALLAEMPPAFLDYLSKKPRYVHDLMKAIAPAIVQNQAAVEAGRVPREYLLTDWLEKVITSYDSLGQVKQLLTMDEKGRSPFLDTNPMTANPYSLVRLMAQEDLMTHATGKEENKWRDPAHVMGLIAWHHAAQDLSKIPEAQHPKALKQKAKFALNFRRLSQALERLGQTETQGFQFEEVDEQSKPKRLREDFERLIEHTLIQNRPIGESEDLNDQERDVAANRMEHVRIRELMKRYLEAMKASEGKTEPEGLIKSLFKAFRKPKIPTSAPLFGETMPGKKSWEEEPQEGERRDFSGGKGTDWRRFTRIGHPAGRWVDDDTYWWLQRHKPRGPKYKGKGYYKGPSETARKYAVGSDKLGRRHWLLKNIRDQLDMFIDTHQSNKAEAKQFYEHTAHLGGQTPYQLKVAQIEAHAANSPQLLLFNPSFHEEPEHHQYKDSETDEIVAQAEKEARSSVNVEPEPEPEPEAALQPQPAPEPLSQAVEKYLQEKQKGKRHKDIGERVHGSRKELAAIRKLTIDQLRQLDHATAKQVTKKSKLIGSYDPLEAKDQGKPPSVAYMVKRLIDSIQQEPEDSDEAREAMVEYLPELVEKLKACTTLDDLKAVLREIMLYDSNGYYWHSDTVTYEPGDVFKNRVARRLRAPKDGAVNLNDVFGTQFYNLAFMKTKTAHETWEAARKLDQISEDEVRQQYDAFHKRAVERYEALKESLDPSKYDWEEAFARYYGKRRVAALSPEAYAKTLGDFIRVTQLNWLQNPKKEAEKTYEQWMEETGIKPHSDDWSWAMSEHKRQKRTDVAIHDWKPLQYIKRVNGRVAPKEISEKAIMEKFGFRAVEFGHYVKDEEAHEHIRHFLAALLDLEDALDIDIKKCIENGGLAMAFGSRGHGKAMASYHPSHTIINITKKRGDGSVAHEFMHYIDHMLGLKLGFSSIMVDQGALRRMKYKQYMRYKGQATFAGHIPPRIASAVQKVMTAIKAGDAKTTIVFEPTGKTPDYTYPSLDRAIRVGGEAAAIAELRRRGFDGINIGKKYFQYIAEKLQKAISLEVTTPHTKYYKEARAFSSDYWSRPEELFARAGEAYVRDKLKAASMYNNYLVADNIAGEDSDGQFLSRAYPQGEERQRINQAFDHLFSVIREELKLVRPAASSEKRVDEIITLRDDDDKPIVKSNQQYKFYVFGRFLTLDEIYELEKGTDFIYYRYLPIQKARQTELFPSPRGTPGQYGLFPEFGREHERQRWPHKYIRRFKDKYGKWRYIYQEHQTGRHFVADKEGNPIEWNKPIPHPWHSLLDEYIEDLKNGLVTGKYELGEDRTSVIRSIRSIQDRLRELHQYTSPRPEKGETVVNYESAIELAPHPDFKDYVPEKPKKLYSEDDLFAAEEAEKEKAMRLPQPPVKYKKYKVGTWAKDKYGNLYRLEELRIGDLEWQRGLEDNPTTRKYAEWIRSGYEPPPIEVVETADGKLRVIEGHLRGSALQIAGKSTIKAWVSPLHKASKGGLPEPLNEKHLSQGVLKTESGEASDPSILRQQREGTGSLQQAKQFTKALSPQYRNRIIFTTHDNAPKDVQEILDKKTSALYHKGKIYIFENGDHRSILHELGHLAIDEDPSNYLRKLFGEHHAIQFLDKLWQDKSADIQKSVWYKKYTVKNPDGTYKYEEYNPQTLWGRRNLVHEYVAHINEDNDPATWNRLVAWVLSLLRQVMPGLKFTKYDVQEFLRRSMKAMADSPRRGAVKDKTPIFNIQPLREIRAKFVAPAIKVGDTVYSGKRGGMHADIIMNMNPDHLEEYLNAGERAHWKMDGFLDETGAFVARADAVRSGRSERSTDIM